MAKAFEGFPAAGKPGGQASRFLRVDVNPETVFDSLIETKTPRLGWARATLCPCAGFNSQTKQLDPNCPSCNGLGWAYFRPASGTYKVNTDALGSFDAEQKATLDRANAVVIRGFMSSLESEPDMFRALGHWVFGSSRLTTRGANKLGYYDRIISIDERIVYSEFLDLPADGTIKTRYNVVKVNDLRSTTKQFTDDDVELVAGKLVWKAGKQPAANTRISVHYLYHPVWVVVQHLHVARSSLVKFRRQPKSLQTPEGDTTELPVQALVRLEHLDLSPKE